MEIDKLAMLDLSKVITTDGSNPSFQFLHSRALMLGNPSSSVKNYFLFYLHPDDEAKFQFLLRSMFDYRCCPEISRGAQDARKDGASFILYYL